LITLKLIRLKFEFVYDSLLSSLNIYPLFKSAIHVRNTSYPSATTTAATSNDDDDVNALIYLHYNLFLFLSFNF